MATIHTDRDVRPALKLRADNAALAAIKFSKEGNSEMSERMSKIADVWNDDLIRECRKWRENTMTLIDGSVFTNSGGNTALATRR